VPEAPPPRVFISYSHDSEPHRDRVLGLADRLRDDGVDASIDQYVQSPPEGWPSWCAGEIRRADFIVMVCTETYRRRIDREEEPGQGHGVLWEGRLIYQHLYNGGAASKKLVPVLFTGGAPEHVPDAVAGASIHRVETREGYEALLRVLTDQPPTPKPPIGRRKALPPRQRRSEGAAQGPSKLAASLPHPRVEDVFVGRQPERAALAAGLFPASGARRPVVVSGMPGVGKSYLVDRFSWESAARFPGGYVRLPLDPHNPGTTDDLAGMLGDRLKLAARDETLVARLLTPLTLVHVENADTRDAGRVVGDLAAALPACALVVTARDRGLGSAAGWRQIQLAPFDEATALAQLEAELGRPRQESWSALTAALGCLPLALHLAAGYLGADQSVAAFLRRLRSKKLALEQYDPADPSFRDRARALLSDTFDLSLQTLRREGSTAGKSWVSAFLALGHGPAAGFGESLGAAIAGLPPDAFEDMALAAARLSLLDRVPRDSDSAFRLHPLLAELGRGRADNDVALARITAWFIERLPEGSEDQGRRWREVHDEAVALIEWLAQVPTADRVRIARAGSRYAIVNGPYHGWVRYCEETLGGEIDDVARSHVLWTLGNVALYGGLPDRALTAAEQKRGLDQRRDDERDAALASGLVADILEARGDLDSALRIRREDELPVYERLGDVRSAAVTKGEIADILQARGDLDGALRIRREDELPVYERLSDVLALLVGRANLAITYLRRGQEDDRGEARRLLCMALGDARRLRLPEAQQIERILADAGLACD
jgi:tetratricopeptide (TPR) repeat protein